MFSAMAGSVPRNTAAAHPRQRIRGRFWAIEIRKSGAPERIRTPDLRLRRATLYPAELLALNYGWPHKPVVPGWQHGGAPCHATRFACQKRCNINSALSSGRYYVKVPPKRTRRDGHERFPMETICQDLPRQRTGWMSANLPFCVRRPARRPVDLQQFVRRQPHPGKALQRRQPRQLRQLLQRLRCAARLPPGSWREAPVPAGWRSGPAPGAVQCLHQQRDGSGGAVAGRDCPIGAPSGARSGRLHFNLCMFGDRRPCGKQRQTRANDLRQGCSRN